MRKGIDGKQHHSGIGFALGTDFCAEHEWGVQKIVDAFEIDEDTCQIQTLPKGYMLLKDVAYLYLIYYRPYAVYPQHELVGICRRLFQPTSEDWVGFWCDEGFVLGAKAGTEAAETLKFLHEGFETLDVSIGMAPRQGQNPFHRHSLGIVRTSLSEQENG